MNLFSLLIDLFFPNLCVACNESLVKGEEHICMKCVSEIPRTHYHKVKENEIEKRFWGKSRVENATAYFFFEKGSKFQHLLHQLKYRGNKEIGYYLGKVAASELLQNDEYRQIDCVVPVPLHPKRQAKRGYNQSEWIAKGLGEVLGKPLIINNLLRIHESATQTKKSVYERFENTQGIFQVKDSSAFSGKHILLVDDVLTTGSTLEGCMRAFRNIEVKISVFTLAVAK